MKKGLKPVWDFKPAMLLKKLLLLLAFSYAHCQLAVEGSTVK